MQSAPAMAQPQGAKVKTGAVLNPGSTCLTCLLEAGRVPENWGLTRKFIFLDDNINNISNSSSRKKSSFGGNNEVINEKKTVLESWGNWKAGTGEEFHSGEQSL